MKQSRVFFGDFFNIGNGLIILELLKTSESLPAIIYLVIKTWVTPCCVLRNKEKLGNPLPVCKAGICGSHPPFLWGTARNPNPSAKGHFPTHIKGLLDQGVLLKIRVLSKTKGESQFSAWGNLQLCNLCCGEIRILKYFNIFIILIAEVTWRRRALVLSASLPCWQRRDFTPEPLEKRDVEKLQHHLTSHLFYGMLLKTLQIHNFITLSDDPLPFHPIPH